MSRCSIVAFKASRFRERAALVADIEEFTQLNEYLALPLRTYSSGMTVRLSFGLLTALPGDILVVDEAIGAGDVLLLHDGSAHRPSGGNPVVLEVLPRVLDALAARGLRSVPLETAG